MDGTFWIHMLMRWLHIASSAVAVGGFLVLRFAVEPALVGAEFGDRARQAMQPLVKKLMHSALGIALLTGFYNYLIPTMPAVRAAREAGTPGFSAYHPVIGVKILLGIGLFVIAIMLLKPASPAPERQRSLLTTGVVLGLVVTLIGAYLRRLWAL